jgi:hypothetical protein
MFKLCFFEDAFGESAMAITNGAYTIPEGRGGAGVRNLMAAALQVDPDLRSSASDLTAISRDVMNGGDGLVGSYRAMMTLEVEAIEDEVGVGSSRA